MKLLQIKITLMSSLYNTMINIYLIFACIGLFATIASALTDDSTQTNTDDEGLSTVSYVTELQFPLNECDLFDLEPDEYIIFPNGTAYVEAYSRTYNKSFYALVNGFLRVCSPAVEEKCSSKLCETPITYLSFIGVGISIVCLLLHLIAFSFVPDLQNLPGYNLACLCISLLLSYLFMIIRHFELEAKTPLLCSAVGVLIQFFFISSFLWMFVMSFDVLRSILLATGSLRISSKEFKVKKFAWYSMFVWFISLVFSVSALLADHLEEVPLTFKPVFHETCWFKFKSSLLAFFAIPMAVIMCFNFMMFGLSAYTIFTNRMKSVQENQRSNLKKNHLLYFRLSVIMGVTWITGVIAPVVNEMWLWYIFSALNAFQGLFIFLAFTCTTKVKKYFKNKLFNFQRMSEQTVSPTFQSYCYYANSIEKDLDKVMDSKDKSDITDTIIIHL